MYLLNHCGKYKLISVESYLHSTMYLLNPFCVTVSMSVPVYLHSTMYLLNPFDIETSKVNNKFTFHYVSIKSRSFDLGTLKANVFTFHYVSIKSDM